MVTSGSYRIFFIDKGIIYLGPAIIIASDNPSMNNPTNIRRQFAKFAEYSNSTKLKPCGGGLRWKSVVLPSNNRNIDVLIKFANLSIKHFSTQNEDELDQTEAHSSVSE